MSEIQQPAPLSAEDVLYEAARVACLAPSIENSQPWRWRIRGNALELHADRSRQLTVTDPEGRLMIVSCGAVLHHAIVVLAVLGAAATVERIDDPADPDLLARLTLTGPHQVTADDMRLHHALRTRRTDQRPFLGVRPLPDAVIDLLRHTTEPFGVSTHAFDPAQVGVRALVARSAAAVEQRDLGYQDETDTWPTHRIPSTRDGVPATAAVPAVTRTGPAHDFAPGATPGPAPGPGDDRYTTYLAFATAHDTRADWLRTGEALSAVLLTATTIGLASSAMSDVVEVPGARTVLRGAIAPAGYPQLTVRLGVNESAPPVPPASRRPCDEVIEVIATS
ncbi:NAD(P)H nitroreductase [Dactylosporangium fulvum]|uniref:Nitroreductase n=1 Tax=Dactylosporangium fulvum TaxID=53359 RepID=A0ABY5W9T5_9ACTN|nr:nitroreductase [Dactylosporangium fulvum]UWP85453.1 nitroreductase [Dactylosporangium fulvum]